MAWPAIVCDRDVMTGEPDQNPLLAEAQAEVEHPLPEAVEAGEPAYKVPLAVDPASSEQVDLDFANSVSKNAVKAWGDTVGTLAEAEVAEAPASTDS
jgi:hypothetical protein